MDNIINRISGFRLPFLWYRSLWYKRRAFMLACYQRIKPLLFSSLRMLLLQNIFICPSFECNADCVHCYEKYAHKNFRKFLTTQQVKSIIDQFRQLRGCMVYFCSGEFLLRDDALDLVKYVRSNNMLVAITTNGILLDEKKIDDLKAAGLITLIVSIDSANAFRHDELRGVKGCFEKAINGLRIAKRKGITTWIWTYVTKTNFNELDGVSKLGQELGVELVFCFFPLLSGRIDNRFDENLTYEEREAFRKDFNGRSGLLLEFPTENSPCRGGGLVHICVMPSGDVTFCPCVPYSYGNINSRTLKDCLRDILKDKKRFSHLTGQCIVNFPEYRQKCMLDFCTNREKIK